MSTQGPVQADLFDPAAGVPLAAVIDAPPPPTRLGGHRTSVAAAADVAIRAGSQRYRLLCAYADAVPAGLTDEEAAADAVLEHACYWKRCGELRAGGYTEVVLTPDGGEATRIGDAGVRRIVCRLTAKGAVAIETILYDLRHPDPTGESAP